MIYGLLAVAVVNVALIGYRMVQFFRLARWCSKRDDQIIADLRAVSDREAGTHDKISMLTDELARAMDRISDLEAKLPDSPPSMRPRSGGFRAMVRKAESFEAAKKVGK